MKKLTLLLLLLVAACAKEAKDSEEVTRLKQSLAGTTWTYYYKNPFNQLDITTYSFSSNDKVTIREQSEYRHYDNTKVWAYKYE